ncbi:MAG: hypothetical protein ACK4E8_06785 [Lacibacter sp.]|jgi:hypothetical protein
MKKYLSTILFISIAASTNAQTADSIVTRRNKVIKHAFYQKGDWYLSAGAYAQTILNTFSAATLQYANPSASYFHESNQMALVPLVGVRYMVSDRWGINYLPVLRKTLLQDTFVTGTLLSSIMERGKWIVDHHVEAMWFTKPPKDLKHSARAYIGGGVSVMNAFQSFIESREPALLGQRINMMYPAVTVFGGMELSRYSKLLHRLYIEPRIMIVPAMPKYTLANRGPHYIANLRIYKDIFLKNTLKKNK